jgi:hypothetical protein
MLVALYWRGRERERGRPWMVGTRVGRLVFVGGSNATVHAFRLRIQSRQVGGKKKKKKKKRQAWYFVEQSVLQGNLGPNLATSNNHGQKTQITSSTKR